MTFLREVKFESQGISMRAPVRVTFAHGGDCVTSGAESGVLCVWETTTGDQFQLLGHEGALTSRSAQIATLIAFQFWDDTEQVMQEIVVSLPSII